MEKEIIEKASYLFLKYGYKSVTMDDLAEHMRISKKTIYECFGDKISLIRASVWYIFDEVKIKIINIHFYPIKMTSVNQFINTKTN